MMQGKYIVVEGNIGAGKTSLAAKLHQDFGGTVIFEEFESNNFLPLFYKDPDRYALPVELSFLEKRYRQLESFLHQNHKTVFADYHFEKSVYFASINLKSSELALYKSYFDILYAKIRKPDLVVYLYKNVEVLQSNIKKRGRDFEIGITKDYLLKIDNAYREMLQNTGSELCLEIDTSKLDFINKNADYELVINAVKGKLLDNKC